MDTRLFVYLSYADASAALDWMQRVGFDVVRRQDGDGGQVLHAEVRMGEAVLMAAEHVQSSDVIQKLGFKVKGVELSEFAKAEGGVTCLSLLIA